MEALNLLVEEYGEERVLKAVKEVAENWRRDVQRCRTCGDELIVEDGFIGDGGWRCHPCGAKERNWRWGDAVETFEKWSKGASHDD
jgi:ribosomal protein L37AE/L43A